MFRFGAPRESVGMRSVCAENTSVISCHPVIRLLLGYRSPGRVPARIKSCSFLESSTGLAESVCGSSWGARQELANVCSPLRRRHLSFAKGDIVL